MPLASGTFVGSGPDIFLHERFNRTEHCYLPPAGGSTPTPLTTITVEVAGTFERPINAPA